LAKLSHFLKTFQNYYHIDIITEKSREWIPKLFFMSFLNFLMKVGIDDYEDLDNPIPKGHVQILTIHEAKGLEFPVVIVGSLDKRIQNNENVSDKYLKQFYHRPIFEPENRIDEFDIMRQYYVAFSRASKILILTTSNKPNYIISPLYNRLNRWTEINKRLLYNQKFTSKKRFNPKKSYSLTSHINTFEICPRSYQFYKEYDFSPSRSAPRTFGSLVHNTIEEIHNIILDENKSKITIEYIKDFLFENNYKSLIYAGLQPLSQDQKNSALEQIINYFIQNYDILAKIVETEVEVSVEKLTYILSGKIDLIFEENGTYNILDFKTDQKPESDDPLLQLYYKQLYIYAYILKERYGVYPKKLYIYWTSIADREQALVEIPFNENDIRRAGEYFDTIITFIQNKKFKVKEAPKQKICRECDFKKHCMTEGLIKLKNYKV
jgi:DNA helicase-2/ATP-dependent DNA helicase PcrA